MGFLRCVAGEASLDGVGGVMEKRFRWVAPSPHLKSPPARRGVLLRICHHHRHRLLDSFDIGTVLTGTIFTVQKALPLMGKGGSIILTGLSAGTTGAPAFTAYSASKAAVRNLARTWAEAEDLKGTGIRVNVLSPGAIATDSRRQRWARRA